MVVPPVEGNPGARAHGRASGEVSPGPPRARRARPHGKMGTLQGSKPGSTENPLPAIRKKRETGRQKRGAGMSQGVRAGMGTV